jgi:hypothetical protein
MMVTYSGRSVAIPLRVLLVVTVLWTMLGGAGAAWAAPSSPYFTALSTILTTPRSGAVAVPPLSAQGQVTRPYFRMT